MSTKRREYEYGRLVSVDIVPLGDNLAADATAGATSITVEDACDFDEDGGLLLLDAVVYAYATWVEDDSTGVGTLSGLLPPLAANATEGTVVAVYDPMYATAATDKVAQVEVVGDDGNVDMLEADIALHLVDKIDEGVRGVNGEQVKLELEGDEWVIIDIFGLGDPNASGTLFKRDAMTVAATGAQTFPLTYEPIQDSLHLRWEPINLDDTAWTRAGKIVTIPTPNYFEVGDVLTAKYAYRKGSITPAVDFPALVLGYNPLAYYRHGEPSGTTMVDSSGNGHHGTYTGSPTLGASGLLTGSSDTAVSLNGSTQYGRVAYGSWLDDMSVQSASWFSLARPTSVSGPYVMLDRDTGTGGARIFQFGINASHLYLAIWTATGGLFILTGSTTLSTSTTYKLGATFDGAAGVAKVFVNGALDGTLTGITGGPLVISSLAPLSVGVNNSAPAGADVAWFPGKLDESIIFGSLLTESDMADLAAAA